jgi:hypothetical protein
MSLFFLCCMISFHPAMLLGKAPSATTCSQPEQERCSGTWNGRDLQRPAAAENDTGAS